MTSPPPLYPGFSTPDIDRIWSPESRVGAMLRFEEALALALADVGVAPREEAEEAAGACRRPVEDPEGSRHATWARGPAGAALREEVCERRWLRRGASPQD